MDNIAACWFCWFWTKSLRSWPCSWIIVFVVCISSRLSASSSFCRLNSLILLLDKKLYHCHYSLSFLFLRCFYSDFLWKFLMNAFSSLLLLMHLLLPFLYFLILLSLIFISFFELSIMYVLQTLINFRNFRWNTRSTFFLSLSLGKVVFQDIESVSYRPLRNFKQNFIFFLTI